MNFTRIILSIIFVLFASAALAEKPEKTLVCHVGNEFGPDGETYLDDPGCVPVEENGYFCPDAGKIDLIEVTASAAEKHLQNPSHAYLGDDGWVYDYAPVIEVADGGDLDGDGDGIDEGCELAKVLTCPCWAGLTLDDLAGVVDDFLLDPAFVRLDCLSQASPTSFDDSAQFRTYTNDQPSPGTTLLTLRAAFGSGRVYSASCGLLTRLDSVTRSGNDSDAVEWARGCVAELRELMEAGTFCPD